MKRRTNPAMKRRSNKELIVRFGIPSEPRSHPLLDDTLRFDPVTTFWTERHRGRERKLQDKNAERQRKAESDYQTYRDIELKLCDEKPHLRRASRHRVAQAIRAELGKTQSPPSLRTIERAISPKNKV
jgi:hypothetical protein